MKNTGQKQKSKDWITGQDDTKKSNKRKEKKWQQSRGSSGGADGECKALWKPNVNHAPEIALWLHERACCKALALKHILENRDPSQKQILFRV